MARFLDHKQVRDAVQTVIAGDDVRCAVAFWGDGALKTLFGSKKRASKARIICDLSMGGTNPEELTLLGAPDNPDLKHFRGLHAKLYLSSAGMVVTSANASNRGIGFVEPAALTECGTFHRPDTTAFREGAKWFDTLWGKAEMVDPEALATARAAWAKRARPGAPKGAPLTAAQTSFTGGPSLRHVQISKRINRNFHAREVTARLASGRVILWDLDNGIDGVMRSDRRCVVACFPQ